MVMVCIFDDVSKEKNDSDKEKKIGIWNDELRMLCTFNWSYNEAGRLIFHIMTIFKFIDFQHKNK
jgi:hypothetical protein